MARFSFNGSDSPAFGGPSYTGADDSAGLSVPTDSKHNVNLSSWGFLLQVLIIQSEPKALASRQCRGSWRAGGSPWSRLAWPSRRNGGITRAQGGPRTGLRPARPPQPAEVPPKEGFLSGTGCWRFVPRGDSTHGPRAGSTGGLWSAGRASPPTRLLGAAGDSSGDGPGWEEASHLRGLLTDGDATSIGNTELKKVRCPLQLGINSRLFLYSNS